MALSEFALIERYFRACGVQRADVVRGVGDDAALLRVPGGCELVAATDTLVAGVHFPHGSPPASIGHRALAVNLSDLAASGAAGAARQTPARSTDERIDVRSTAASCGSGRFLIRRPFSSRIFEAMRYHLTFRICFGSAEPSPAPAAGHAGRTVT